MWPYLLGQVVSMFMRMRLTCVFRMRIIFVMQIEQLTQKLRSAHESGVSWNQIGKEAGIHYTLITRLVDGTHADPRQSTTSKLISWVEQHERATKRKRKSVEA